MEKRPRLECPFKRGERVRARIVCEGRLKGEKICVARNRSIAVNTGRKVGDFVEFEVVSTKDGIIVGVER